MKKKEKITSISLLSRNLKIEGDIFGNENFRIDGTVKGTVKVAGDVLVEETGTVEADISGENMIIKGTVNGNISANNRIEIYATSVVIGDISARSVDIQEGATFEGRSHMMQANNRMKGISDVSGTEDKKEQKESTAEKKDTESGISFNKPK